MSEPIQSISASALKQLLKAKQNVHLIDVRSPAEYRSLHISVAENYPLDQINEAKLEQLKSRGGDLYFICASGSRSQSACEKAVKHGFSKIHTVEGGTTACQQAGFDVVENTSVMSLERQVRVAAGLLILTGSVGSIFVHPGLVGLAIFVGAGLLFAGLSNWCGMGLLLAKMPWNQ